MHKVQINTIILDDITKSLTQKHKEKPRKDWLKFFSWFFEWFLMKMLKIEKYFTIKSANSPCFMIVYTITHRRKGSLISKFALWRLFRLCRDNSTKSYFLRNPDFLATFVKKYFYYEISSSFAWKQEKIKV